MSSILLPSELRPAYLEASVGNHLTAPANPSAGPLRLNELRNPEDISRLADVKFFQEETGMAVIDKQFPHAVKEVMWLHAEATPRPTLHDYFQADPGYVKARALFSHMASCASAAEAAGDYVSLSWSNDPLTQHRASIQGEKRLHFHLTARQEELEEIPQITTNIGALSFVDRRRLAEEFSVIAKQVIQDICARRALPYELEDIHPCVLSLKIGDWKDLETPDTVTKVANFIEFLETEYDQLAKALGEEPNFGSGIEGADNAYEDRISEVTGLDIGRSGVLALANFIRNTRPWCDGRATRQVEQFIAIPVDRDIAEHRKHLRTAIVPLQGFAYSAAFSRWNGELYLHMRVCKFSDLGGAGCAVIDGMPVRVKKGGAPLTSQQLMRRKKFVNTAIELAAIA
jgi:hypothetical protein